MRKKTSEVEDETPVVNFKDMHRRRGRKSVPLKHLQHPPHRIRTLMGYLAFAVVLFWVFHFLMHVG